MRCARCCAPVGDVVEARERIARAIKIAAGGQDQAEPLGVVGRDRLVGKERAQQALLAVERAFQPIIGQEIARGGDRGLELEQPLEHGDLGRPVLDVAVVLRQHGHRRGIIGWSLTKSSMMRVASSMSANDI